MKTKYWLLILGALFIVWFIYGGLTYKPDPYPQYGITGSTTEESLDALAIQNKDSSICGKIHIIGFSDNNDQNAKEQCYMAYIEAYPDPNVCPLMLQTLDTSNEVMADDTNSAYHQCLYSRAFSLAEKNSDSKYCTMLSSPYESQVCIGVLARYEKKISICDLILDSDARNNCIQQFNEFIK